METASSRAVLSDFCSIYNHVAEIKPRSRKRTPLSLIQIGLVKSFIGTVRSFIGTDASEKPVTSPIVP
jgi:hypothetical protein